MKISLTAATLAALVLAAPAFAGDAAKGEKEFNKCKTCHSIIAPDGTEIVKGAKTGPNLYGVVGRTAGTLAGFNYSPALKASKLKWDEKALDEYLAAPTKKVPGSRMPISTPDPAKRAAIITYLKSVK